MDPAGAFGSSPDSLPEVAQPSVFSYGPRGQVMLHNGHSPGAEHQPYPFEMSPLGKQGRDMHAGMMHPMYPVPPQYQHPHAHQGRTPPAPPLLSAHQSMLPILNPLPAFASPPTSPVPDEAPASEKRRRRGRSEDGSDPDSDGNWTDTPRGDGDEPMPKWSVRIVYVMCA